MARERVAHDLFVLAQEQAEARAIADELEQACSRFYFDEQQRNFVSTLAANTIATAESASTNASGNHFSNQSERRKPSDASIWVGEYNRTGFVVTGQML